MADEAASWHTGVGGNRPYRETMLRRLKDFPLSVRVPTFVGLPDDRRQMASRPPAIARFGHSRQWTAASLGLFLVLAAVTLTDGRPRQPNVRGSAITPWAVGMAIPGQHA